MPFRRYGQISRFCCLFTASVALLGCGSHKPHHADDPLARMIYSPNGEPLNGGPLGRPTCQDALSQWFGQVDANHDGAISHGEFSADAKTQFARMDIDKNGYLVSEELERFRKPYRQGSYNPDQAAHEDTAQPQESGQGHGHGHGHGGGGRNKDSGQSQNTQAESDVDPVMSADTNLDFKVTPEEFMAHADKIFSGLDANHDNILNKEEILLSCPAN